LLGRLNFVVLDGAGTKCVFFVLQSHEPTGEAAQIRWNGWQREDGTSTTWEADRPELTEDWDRKQKAKRLQLAANDLTVDLAAHGTDVTNMNTILRSRAYDEKLSRLKAQPSVTRGWDAVERFEQETLARPGKKNGPMSRVSSSSPPSSSSVTWGGGAPSSSSSERSTVPSPRRIRALPRRVVSPSVSDATPPLHPKRCALVKKWTQATKSAGAASIDIVNDVDSDELPPLEDAFQYTERKYA
jgi:histone-lysine N-methyltransferase SUV39H